MTLLSFQALGVLSLALHLLQFFFDFLLLHVVLRLPLILFYFLIMS